MRRKSYLGPVCLLVFTLTPFAASLETAPPAGQVDVLFSPDGGCEARVVEELGRATKSIRLQAYTFTSPAVVRALSEAKTRGVDCEIMLDKSNRTDKFSAAPAAREAGIPCLIDDSHMVANNKVIIIDGTTVLTGSFNYTRAAELSNAENLLIISGMPLVAKAYTENYVKHREHAKPYSQTAQAAALVSSEAPEPSAPPAKGKVYVTPNGKKYHAAGCEFLRGGGKAIDRSEIKGKYTPCSKCHP